MQKQTGKTNGDAQSFLTSMTQLNAHCILKYPSPFCSPTSTTFEPQNYVRNEVENYDLECDLVVSLLKIRLRYCCIAAAGGVLSTRAIDEEDFKVITIDCDISTEKRSENYRLNGLRGLFVDYF